MLHTQDLVFAATTSVTWRFHKFPASELVWTTLPTGRSVCQRTQPALAGSGGLSESTVGFTEYKRHCTVDPMLWPEVRRRMGRSFPQVLELDDVAFVRVSSQEDPCRSRKWIWSLGTLRLSCAFFKQVETPARLGASGSGSATQADGRTARAFCGRQRRVMQTCWTLSAVLAPPGFIRSAREFRPRPHQSVAETILADHEILLLSIERSYPLRNSGFGRYAHGGDTPPVGARQ